MSEMLVMGETVAALLAPGKGILAADESFGTIGKRFAALQIPVTEANRRAYRGLLFTTPGLGEFISGAILFDETIYETIGDAASMPTTLAEGGIVPGIKVDLGAKPLPGFDGERLTYGLDGLRERLLVYREHGARFTKWRAVMEVEERLPTKTCIEANATMLALFAALSQEAGLVPIVEPEVLMNGNHTIARCEEVMTLVLRTVFDALFAHRVAFERMLLKTGMVLPGEECSSQADVDIVAEATRRCLLRTVPASVPGVVFLSGGQTEEAATLRLNAICRSFDAPWKLSFSFGRALQSSAMKLWKGATENEGIAQNALLHRARCNSTAVRGNYSRDMEQI